MNPLKLFTTLFAFSMVFQLFAMGSAFYGFQAETITWYGMLEPALLITACYAIISPSLRALLVIASLQALDAARMFPDIANYRLITFVVSISILAISIHERLKQPTAPIDEKRVFVAIRQVVRLEFLGFYSFAALHKLNSDFINSAVSCGTGFYSRMASWFILAPRTHWAAEGAIHLTLLCEVSIPCLLLFRRTRVFGILVGLLFHSALTLDIDQHVMDFTSLLISFFFLFTPDNWLTVACSTLSPPPNIPSVVASRLRCAALTLILSTTTLSLLPTDAIWGWFPKHFLWFGYAAVCITAYARVLVQRRQFESPDPLFRLSSPWHVLFPLLLFVNGAGPYLGLRTRIAFDMYSNLRMEEPHPNHLIVPHSLDLFGWQADRVQILDSSDPYLRRLTEQRKDLLYVRLRSYLAERPDVSLQFRRRGEVISVPRAGDYQDFRDLPWAIRRLVFFRPIDRDEQVRCDW